MSKEKSAFIFGFYRVIAHRAVTFQAANDEPPLVRLPHTGFVRRIRARTSLTNAPPRLLVQTALAFRPPPVFSTRPIAFGKSEKVARFP